ncbi:MAG TPA: D-alanine--D-alanine ligase [Flavobacteriaceae bacterium]|nr:D-alanine--D-alanine ligase [Flavobacteriaceae bacterium]MCB9214169.1 D-alanine--D-alanine ligase [Alteromonas sp.]HPF12555.1 D-alanine--D-alanine ligase [Flavobacteriaceae bacterium]HQU22457.1 D-alanine--D-alanine ligase [Flavobacteriaceae bacterium]HQU66422.1 D-alanine--D-alanine ligase [Flavobacteriaceae bacterium]
MAKLLVAVAMGGYSSEKEISLQSGLVVSESLDPEKFEVYPIHILKEGWFYQDGHGKRFAVDKSNFSFSDGSQTIQPDVVFNTIHGTPGEDGYLAAYWELLEIPYTSTGFYPAALSFNKRDCLSVLKNFGIKCANSYYVNQGDKIATDSILKTVGLPCFVKPNRSGSSFGVSKVNTTEELHPAMEKAFLEDKEIIVETALKGIEVSVGVYRKGNELVAFSPTEIVPENDFFDYEAKYLGKSQEITPARISEEETLKVQNEAKKIYHLLNMKGITRSDFIIQDGIPYFIETNTTPGLSKESIVPKQAREAGMTLTQFFTILIEHTLIKK